MNVRHEQPFEGFPLRWPEGVGRTAPWKRQRARFDLAFGRARNGLVHELEMMNARYIVITSDLPIRRDGLPYASSHEPPDTGIAVYFEFSGKSHCFACDRWDKVADNLRAVAKTIEALRGIERWGSSSMVARAFAGFEALPPNGGTLQSWRDVLGSCATLADARSSYRQRAASVHPDVGGAHEEMVALNQAMAEAEKELG